MDACGRRRPIISARGFTSTRSISAGTARAAGPTATIPLRSTPTTCGCSSPAVGVDKAILAGQSLGGRVGIVFAAVHPERALGLALVGGPHLSNFYPTREAVLGVLAASQRMLESETEFASKDAALAYLRKLRPRDREEALGHRVEHNLAQAGTGWAVKYDKVRVALGLAHMADDLKSMPCERRARW